jgi:transcriptional regulator with XRE-family HTH domain
VKTFLKTEACVLRRRGYSFRQISERVNISKSTASLWTRGVVLSELGLYRIRKNIENANIVSGEVLHKRKLERLAKADSEAELLLRDFAKSKVAEAVILSMLYECEGGKSERGMRFANSDTNLVSLFLATLRSVFDIDESRLMIRLHIHDNQDEIKLKKLWSNVTKIPLSQFYKSFQKPSNHLYKKDGYNGCVHLSYGDSHVVRVIRAVAKKVIRFYS